MKTEKKAPTVAEPTAQTTTPDATTQTASQTAAPSEPTLEQLEANVEAANAHLQTTVASKNYMEIGKASTSLNETIKAVNKFHAKLEAGKAEAEAAAKREASIDFVVDKLGISRERFNYLIEADKADANQPLRNALQVAFGGKVVVAREGQTGKSLTGEHATRGGKSTEIEEYLLSGGVTKADMLEKYPTVSDGIVNNTKINGTARTVISLNGWELNKVTGIYEKTAK